MSVLDRPREHLDLNLFEFTGETYHLKPIIREQILRTIDPLKEFAPLENVYIVGSILSYNWQPRTDIDIHLAVLSNDEEIIDKATDYIWEQPIEFAVGTQHPLEFYVRGVGGMAEESSEGLYNVIDNEWIRGPYKISADVTTYATEFSEIVARLDLEKGSLIRDLIDYKRLEDLGPGGVEDLQQALKFKMQEIDDEVQKLIDEFEDTHEARNIALNREISPALLMQWQERKLLPGNVIYKLLQRYYYIQFLKELRQIVRKGNTIDTSEEVSQVSQALQTNLQKALPEDVGGQPMEYAFEKVAETVVFHISYTDEDESKYFVLEAKYDFPSDTEDFTVYDEKGNEASAAGKEIAVNAYKDYMADVATAQFLDTYTAEPEAVEYPEDEVDAMPQEGCKKYIKKKKKNSMSHESIEQAVNSLLK